MAEETPTAFAIRMIQEEERERCAKVAETIPMYHSNPDFLNVEKRVAADIAAAIRRRPLTPP